MGMPPLQAMGDNLLSQDEFVCGQLTECTLEFGVTLVELITRCKEQRLAAYAGSDASGSEAIHCSEAELSESDKASSNLLIGMKAAEKVCSRMNSA